LALFGVASLHMKEYKTAAILIILWSSVIFIILDAVYSISASGSLAGVFFVFIIASLLSLILLAFYKTEKHTILLKLSTALIVSSAVNILCIMTFIATIRDTFWYYAPFFDLFYWHYGELQIVLTLYMISLFWKSGIMGLSNGLDKIFRPNPTGKYINSVHNFHGGVVTDSNSSCKEVAQENKIHKKGTSHC